MNAEIITWLETKIVEVDGVRYLNLTPHSLNFGSGVDEPSEFEFTIPPSGIVLEAIPEEEEFSCGNGVTAVKVTWRPKVSEMTAVLDFFQGKAVVIVSNIAGQAHAPCHSFGVTPAKGFERRPPAEKRMNPKKFQFFGE